MDHKTRVLLTVDAAVNCVLGILLLLFPWGMAEALGVPPSAVSFYPTILGGVILGIGIALAIERSGHPRHIRGLGLEGAIAINFCGATVLLMWLLAGSLDLPPRGSVVLWSVVVVVFALAIAEAIYGARPRP
jgi:hypothetical protein